MIYFECSDLCLRAMVETDVEYFTYEFVKIGYGYRKKILTDYLHGQQSSKRAVIVAEWNKTPAGYLNLVPDAAAGPFVHMGLPEIKDFNVLPPYRNMGIGGKMMDCVESIARETSDCVTLGVGMYASYGAAQRMYAKRGYIPDGSGLWYRDRCMEPGENCVLDDDLVLYLIKRFN